MAFDKYKFLTDKGQRIEKIILENGKEINLNDIPHIFIYRVAEIMNDSAQYDLTYNLNDNKEAEALSNHCFMMSNIIRYMAEYGLTFEEAFDRHVGYLAEKLAGNVGGSN